MGYFLHCTELKGETTQKGNKKLLPFAIWDKLRYTEARRGSMNIFLQRAQEWHGELSRLRRTIHQHPELGFQEVRTSALVAETLRGLGLAVQTHVGKTGVVGRLGQGAPVVAVRADMDALPIQEATAAPYQSQVPGVMHACGHDAHTAIVLGVARLLAESHAQSPLPGEVRFLFQPAEEISDADNKSGAMRMIEDGAMEGVGAVFALHVNSAIQVGQVGVGPGLISSSVDTFYATIIGSGGHGAYPHRATDAIYLTAQVLTALYALRGRRLDPLKPSVLSVGTIHGGTIDNVLPPQVELSGTIRSHDQATRARLFEELERALSVARALGGDYHLKIEEGYPVAYDAPALAELVRDVARDLLGEANLQPPRLSMGAEDFGLLAQQAHEGGAMFSLGIAGDERTQHPGHSPLFDLDERALPIGAAILAETVVRYLNSRARPT